MTTTTPNNRNLTANEIDEQNNSVDSSAHCESMKKNQSNDSLFGSFINYNYSNPFDHLKNNGWKPGNLQRGKGETSVEKNEKTSFVRQGKIKIHRQFSPTV